MNANEVHRLARGRAARARRCTPTTTSTTRSRPTTSSRRRSTSPRPKAVVADLQPALAHLAPSLEAKARRVRTVVKSGRTHLMDATPVTLGQEFGGYAAQVRLRHRAADAVLPRSAELPLGGTAVGTGINAPAGFAGVVIALIARRPACR
jgi:fumarate hydratase class II